MSQLFESSSIRGPREDLPRAFLTRLNQELFPVGRPQPVSIVAFLAVGERRELIADQIVDLYLQLLRFDHIDRSPCLPGKHQGASEAPICVVRIERNRPLEFCY